MGMTNTQQLALAKSYLGGGGSFLILILLKPEEHTEILRVAEHYFKDLKGNWYMTSIFSNWLKNTKTGEPEWFDSKE